MDPEVENVVQEDVGEERADTRPLRRSPVRLVPYAALQDPGPQPPPDKTVDAWGGDPVRDHSPQPRVVDRVEEAADVRIEHPGHALAHDGPMQGIESHVRAPSWREPKEVDFVDGAQHLGDGALDDLVLQRQNTERSPSAFGIWTRRTGCGR